MKVILLKMFDAIFEKIKNNVQVDGLLNMKSCASRINLRPLKIKLLSIEKAMVRRNYGFDETFNIFDEIDNKRNKLNEYEPRSDNNINNKNPTPEYLKVRENNLIDTFSASSISKKEAMSTTKTMWIKHQKN